DNPGKVSELTAGCLFAKTGNHSDTDFACGPNSDHIKEMTCAHKTYGCNTTSYAEAPGVCEKGDLSGKFGTMKAVSGKISETWIDTGNYPTVAKYKYTWSIVLQAVCGTATHRFVCVKGKVYNRTNTTTSVPVISPLSVSGTPTSKAEIAITTSSTSSVKASVVAITAFAIVAALF
ncbi:hypothetical protein DYB31_010781, partial [Aphanomyces astaci]